MRPGELLVSPMSQPPPFSHIPTRAPHPKRLRSGGRRQLFRNALVLHGTAAVGEGSRLAVGVDCWAGPGMPAYLKADDEDGGVPAYAGV